MMRKKSKRRIILWTRSDHHVKSYIKKRDKMNRYITDALTLPSSIIFLWSTGGTGHPHPWYSCSCKSNWKIVSLSLFSHPLLILIFQLCTHAYIMAFFQLTRSLFPHFFFFLYPAGNVKGRTSRPHHSSHSRLISFYVCLFDGQHKHTRDGC